MSAMPPLIPELPAPPPQLARLPPHVQAELGEATDNAGGQTTLVVDATAAEL